jgi:multidrug efflux pump subunit AcrA (membrane-fusion protein)
MSSVSRKPLIAVAAVAVAAAGLWWWFSRSHTAVATPGAVPVQVVEVMQRDVSDVIRAVGTVRSQRSVVIRPQVDGELLELLVREGQQVKRGDLLVRIDDRAIVAALDQAKAQLAVSEAQLKSATLDLERYRSLQKDHVISMQVLDQQGAQVDQLAASVRNNQAAIAARLVQLSYTRIYSPTAASASVTTIPAACCAQPIRSVCFRSRRWLRLAWKFPCRRRCCPSCKHCCTTPRALRRQCSRMPAKVESCLAKVSWH